MSKNDDRIIELKKQIELKRRELSADKLKFSPETNCILQLEGETYNLNVCGNDTLTILMIRLNSYKMSAEDLDIDVPDISGYPVETWIKDIKNKVNVIKAKEEEKKLKSNEKLLEQLLSEDKKTELTLDEIAASLK